MPETLLDRNYNRAVADVRARVLSYAQRSWNGLGSYRDADAERLIAALVPRVEAGQKRVAELTDAYLSRLAASQLGISIVRGAVASVSTEDLRGVPAETVYRRPFATTYSSLSNGDTVTKAIGSGSERLTDLVSTGLQLAKTHSARQAMSRTGVELFQRTLTGRENCALCVIASTQRYRKGNLMPIHPGCDCGIKTFIGNPDQQVIAPDLLEQTHAVIRSKLAGTDRGARDLELGKFTQTGISDFTDLIVTHQHGEIGPVLAYRGDHFTGPGSIPA